MSPPSPLLTQRPPSHSRCTSQRSCPHHLCALGSLLLPRLPGLLCVCARPLKAGLPAPCPKVQLLWGSSVSPGCANSQPPAPSPSMPILSWPRGLAGTSLPTSGSVLNPHFSLVYLYLGPRCLWLPPDSGSSRGSRLLPLPLGCPKASPDPNPQSPMASPTPSARALRAFPPMSRRCRLCPGKGWGQATAGAPGGGDPHLPQLLQALLHVCGPSVPRLPQGLRRVTPTLRGLLAEVLGLTIRLVGVLSLRLVRESVVLQGAPIQSGGRWCGGPPEQGRPGTPPRAPLTLPGFNGLGSWHLPLLPSLHMKKPRPLAHCGEEARLLLRPGARPIRPLPPHPQPPQAQEDLAC